MSKSKPAQKALVEKEKRAPAVHYSEEIIDKICARIAQGEALHVFCLEKGFPAESTVYRWLETEPEFREKYVRAREMQAERYAAEIIAIADDSTNDTQVDKDGNEVVNHDHIARARLRVEARKWTAAKLLPKKYGDVNRTEITGADGAPIQLEARRTINFDQLDDEKLEQIETALRLLLENKSE